MSQSMDEDTPFGSWRAIIGSASSLVTAFFAFACALCISVSTLGWAQGLTIGAVASSILAVIVYWIVRCLWDLAVVTGLAARVAAWIFR